MVISTLILYRVASTLAAHNIGQLDIHVKYIGCFISRDNVDQGGMQSRKDTKNITTSTLKKENKEKKHIF